MNTKSQTCKTIDFYNTYAEQYVTETIDLDVSDNRNIFLNLLPKPAQILDLGCGSGRDSRFFIDHGYDVIAIDAAPEIARIASEKIGKRVEIQSFHELNYVQAFDGIWACASLLHCPKSQISDLITKIIRALKRNGIIYMSFKYGQSERIDERGRFFNDYTENEMSNVINAHSNFYIINMFTETKPLRNSFQTWLNVFAKKTNDD